MKTIIHYVDGSSYTLKDKYIDCSVMWGSINNLLCAYTANVVGEMYIDPDKVLYIEDIDREAGQHTIYHPPELKMSIDVMTARSRMKRNNEIFNSVHQSLSQISKYKEDTTGDGWDGFFDKHNLGV